MKKIGVYPVYYANYILTGKIINGRRVTEYYRVLDLRDNKIKNIKIEL